MKRYLVLLLCLFAVFFAAIYSDDCIANELFPYVLEEAENGYMIGNENYFVPRSEGEVLYLATRYLSSSHTLSLTLDVAHQKEYELWVRVRGAETFTVTLRQKNQVIYQQNLQGSGPDWGWIKMRQTRFLSPGRYYLDLSNFSGQLDIDKVLIKTVEPGQVSTLSETVTPPVIPTESPWVNQGLNPFASVLSNGQESVSTTSGILNIVATDVAIPGRGGVNLVLSRYISSKPSSQTSYFSGYYLAGSWEFAFPKVLSKKLLFPNASIADLNLLNATVVSTGSNTRKRMIENAVNQYFLFIQHEKKATILPNDWDIEYYEVYLKDGTYWRLNSQGLIEKISKLNSSNYLQFSYDANNELIGIRDSAERTYTFNRSSDGKKIEFVRNPNTQDTTSEVLVTYTFGDGTFCVTDALGRETTYLSGDEGVYKIIYPSGKKSEYEYRNYQPDGATSSLYWVTNHYIKAVDEKMVRRTEFVYTFDDIEQRKIDFIQTKEYGYDAEQNETLYSSTYHHANEFGMIERTKTIDELNQKVEKTVFSIWDDYYHLTESQEYYGNIYQPYYDSSITHNAIQKDQLDMATQEALKVERWIYDFYGNVLYYRDPLGYETKTVYVNATSNSFYGTQEGEYPFYDNQVVQNLYTHSLPAGRLQIREIIDDLNFNASQVYYKYDAKGQLVETKQREYDKDLQKETFIITKYEDYDSYGNCRKVTYDADLLTGGKPITVLYEYDYSTYKSAYLTKTKQSISKNLLDDEGSAALVTTTYDYYFKSGLKKTITDDKEHTILYEYDALGRPVKVTYPIVDGEAAASYEEVIYDDAGNRAKVIDAKQDSLIVHHFDALGQEIKVETFDGFDSITLEGTTLVSSYQKEYNWQGAVVKEIDPQNRITEYEYDVFGRQTRIITEPDVIFPAGVAADQIITQGRTETIIHYDDKNSTVTTTNPNLHTTQTVFDAKGQKILVETDNNGVLLSSEFRYDGFGNLIWTKDAEGKEMAYDYNDLGQLVQTRYPAANGMVYNPSAANLTEKKFYDHYGNLKKSIDRMGREVNFDYNEYNQLIKVDSSPASSADEINYYYNRIGQLVQVGIGSIGAEQYVKVFQYDARSRLTNEEITLIPGQMTSKKYKTSYHYDKNGNITGIVYPNSAGNMTYGYDALDRIDTMTWGALGIVNDVTYLPSNLPSSVTFGNSVIGSTKYIYVNGQYLPKNIAYSLDERQLGVFDYTYDTLGNVIRMNNHQYEYDDLGQLVGWKYFQDNDQVLLGEELIWDKPMTSSEGLNLSSTVISDSGLQLGKGQYQGVAEASQILDLHDKTGINNLLENPSFEATKVGTSGLPSGWFRNIYGTNLNRIRIVPDGVGGVGSQAVMLDNTGTAVMSLNIESREIPVVPGKVYRQSGWLKGTGGAKLYFGRVWFDSNGTRLNYNYTASYVNPSAWTYYESTVTAPAGAATCRIWCTNHSNNTGIGYFDNLAFVEDTGASDLWSGTTNVIKTGAGYELVKQSYMHHEDFKDLGRINSAATTAVVNVATGTVTLPANTTPLFDMGTRTNLNLKLSQVLIDHGNGPTPVPVSTPSMAFSGPQVEKSSSYDPRSDSTAPWKLLKTVMVPKDALQFVKDLQVDISCTIKNHWVFFGWWGDWDLWVRIKIAGTDFDYFKFTADEQSEEMINLTRCYDFEEFSFNNNVPVEIYYLVNKWQGGPVDGGTINYIKFTALTEIGYPISTNGVSVSSPYKLTQKLESGKIYHFNVNEVTPANTDVRYELRSATARVKDLTPNGTFTVSTKQDYYILPYLKTSYLGSTPTVNGFSVKEIPDYISSAKVELNAYQAEKACKTFEIITNDENGSYIDYELKNGTTASFVKATGSNGRYTVTFSQPGNSITLRATLRTDARQSIAPVIRDVYIKAIDPAPYQLPGKIITQDITVTNPSLRLLLELNDVHTELIDVALKVGATVIPGVYKTIEELSTTGTVGLTGIGSSTALSYYQFDLPTSLQNGSFAGKLEFTLKPDATQTITPALGSFTLFNYFDGYVYNGSFTGFTPVTTYSFDKVKLNATAVTPTGASIGYQVMGSSIIPDTIKSLSQSVNQVQIQGNLATANNLVTPKITNLKVTAVGETPLQNALETTDDLDDRAIIIRSKDSSDPIDPVDSVPPIGVLAVPGFAVSADRVVGDYSIRLDHTLLGRGTWTYRLSNTQQFDATKLPYIQIWVKPETENSSLSFSIFDVQENRDERIRSDSDGNGIFEVAKDLVLGKWNLVLLDLSKTNYGGIQKYAGQFKIILNNSSTVVSLDGISSLPANEVSYVYDRVGNRKEYWENGNVTTYYYAPGTNRLVEVNHPAADQRIEYDYDYNGNMTYKKIQQGVNSVTYNFIYNAFNQMTEVKKDGATIAKYEYDHQGLRYKKIDYVKNQTTIYIYGAGNEPLYEEMYDHGSYTTPIDHASYLYMGTRRVARDDSEGLAYYYTDHLGSTRIVQDASGNCTYNDYAPFGADFGTSNGERYKFTGKEDDGIGGLYYYNARYYDPGIGRFVSEDPVKDGVNWFAYCENNPLRYVDPTGKYSRNPKDYRSIHGHTEVTITGQRKLSKAKAWIDFIVEQDAYERQNKNFADAGAFITGIATGPAGVVVAGILITADFLNNDEITEKDRMRDYIDNFEFRLFRYETPVEHQMYKEGSGWITLASSTETYCYILFSTGEFEEPEVFEISETEYVELIKDSKELEIK